MRDPSDGATEKIIELTHGIACHWRQLIIEARQEIPDQALGTGAVLVENLIR
jgi:hypothetical protein